VIGKSVTLLSVAVIMVGILIFVNKKLAVLKSSSE